MNLMLHFVRVCVAAFLFFATTSQPSVAQDAVPGWHSNLTVAQQLAEESGKPLFIVFRCVR